jgi:hypothetical protein
MSAKEYRQGPSAGNLPLLGFAVAVFLAFGFWVYICCACFLQLPSA